MASVRKHKQGAMQTRRGTSGGQAPSPKVVETEKKQRGMKAAEVERKQREEYRHGGTPIGSDPRE